MIAAIAAYQELVAATAVGTTRQGFISATAAVFARQILIAATAAGAH